jgi:HlyD family secretion protein
MEAKKGIRWILPAVLIAAVALWAAFALFGKPDASTAYRTSPADRGTVTRVVSATGALQPVVTVDVGSTVSGPILSVDVDFNDRVTKGQVLARIDPISFQARVQQLSASVAQARADLGVAQTDWQRYSTLGAKGFAAPQLLKEKQAALQRASAAVQVAQAQLNGANVDLSRTVIRAPVTGVVVDRKVEPGQTVAASFTAPSLFLIAQDLSALEAVISVDEADIGDVREGQSVRFNVDAFPGEDFDGNVVQVRQQGVATNGVVSYSVVVRAANPGGRLLPGMTANAEILIEDRPNVLRVPNAALRFRPSDPKLQALAQEQAKKGGGDGGGGAQAANKNGGGGQRGQGGQGRGAERMIQRLGLDAQQAEKAKAIYAAAAEAAGPRPGQDAPQEERRTYQKKMRDAALRELEPILTPAQKAKLAEVRREREGARAKNATLWVLRDNKPAPVNVRLGVAGDAYTEVEGGGLKEGDALITGGGPADNQKKKGGQGPMGGGGGPRIRGV